MLLAIVFPDPGPGPVTFSLDTASAMTGGWSVVLPPDQLTRGSTEFPGDETTSGDGHDPRHADVGPRRGR